MKTFFRIFLLLTFFMAVLSFSFHPYHVGSVELNHNKNSKNFEITGRFFIDDLENAINKKFGTTLHFQDPKKTKEMNAALEKYTSQYIKLKVNNEFVSVKYLGYEEDKESVDLFLESAPVENPKKVEAAISMLYNLFDDQMNIIHIIVNGERKSEKLNYPNRYLYQQF